MHILIVCNTSNEKAVEARDRIISHRGFKGIDFTTESSIELPLRPNSPLEGNYQRQGLFYPHPECGERIDMVVTLGGDGTMLRAARQVGVSGVPILGINFGHLGFLANPVDEDPVTILEAALRGEASKEERMNLTIDLECPISTDTVHTENQDVRELGTTVIPTALAETEMMTHQRFFSLNELAITRGAMGRMIDLSIHIDKTHLANMRGDGLVISSATGSTAYALSAGGPLMSPTHQGILITPLASHSLRMRPVVTAQGEAVIIDLLSNEATRAATLFIDGVAVEMKTPVARATITAGIRPTTLLRYRSEGFYSRAAKAFL